MLIFQASPGAQTFHWPQLALLTTLHTWDDLGRSMQIYIPQQIFQMTDTQQKPYSELLSIKLSFQQICQICNYYPPD